MAHPKGPGRPPILDEFSENSAQLPKQPPNRQYWKENNNLSRRQTNVTGASH